jgi:tRNA nucleotidyltransferase/poly(A) polymerase
MGRGAARGAHRVAAALRRWSSGGDIGAWAAPGTTGASRTLATGRARGEGIIGSGHLDVIVRYPHRDGRRASWEPWRAPFARAASSLAPEPSAASDDDDDIPRLTKLKRLKIGELRELLAQRGLDGAGIRDVLIDRLDRHRGGGGVHGQMEPNDDDDGVHGIDGEGADSAEDSEDDLGVQTGPPDEDEAPVAGAPGPRERILKPHEHGIDQDLIPKHVRFIARRLASVEYHDGSPKRPKRTLIVGGAVRDLLLGKTPRDFDLITDATWGQIKRTMGRRAIIVGRRFRVAHVYSSRPGDPRADMCELVAMQEHDRVERARRSGQIESIRSRRLASQGAMPGDGGKWDTDHDVGDDDILYGDSIRENDARENDSQRQRWLRRLRVNARGRDFTVNGMMYDVRTGDLYDFCGGLDDVEGKCVRTINRADEAFAADPTLMLRAIRVAARHGLQPTREILAATRAHAPAIRTASAMRVAGELRTLLSGGYAAESVRSLWETGLLEHVAPAHAQYLAKSVNPDSNFVARPLSLGPLESSAGVERESPSVRTLLEPKPWERRKSGSSTTDAGHDGRHRRASKRVSDATTDRLFERDPFFAMLRAVDRFATITNPASEELVFAALAAPLAIRSDGWPHMPKHVPDEVKRLVGMGGMETELARYDSWWRSLPAGERAAMTKKTKNNKDGFVDGGGDGGKGLVSWAKDWCAWSLSVVNAQLALRDYSPSTRGTLFNSFAVMHLPALTSRAAVSALGDGRKGRREHSNGDGVIGLSDADFRKTLSTSLARQLHRLAEKTPRNARGSSRSDAVSLKCQFRAKDAACFLRMVLEARRMCRGTEEEFDEGRYDGPDAVVNEDEPL